MSIAVAMPARKKQAAAIQPLTANCSEPLMPWPLVQPLAQRAPKPIRMPQSDDQAHRGSTAKGLSPMVRDPARVKGARQLGGDEGSHDDTHHQHPLPVNLGPEELVIGFLVDARPRKEPLDHAAGPGEGR